jgi:hypothetical protein
LFLYWVSICVILYGLCKEFYAFEFLVCYVAMSNSLIILLSLPILSSFLVLPPPLSLSLSPLAASLQEGEWGHSEAVGQRGTRSSVVRQRHGPIPRHGAPLPHPQTRPSRRLKDGHQTHSLLHEICSRLLSPGQFSIIHPIGSFQFQSSCL